jgi:demethylmenaquinone methyltransferase/2-methoxy-6-polyprenyl-1,4-benzoquinol methylase
MVKARYTLPMVNEQMNETVDFGFRQVPLDEKKDRVREVFQSVAGKYDVMNDLMSLGVHRLWKREFCAALEPRPGRTLLDLAGGTGDITFGWLTRRAGSARWPGRISPISRSCWPMRRRCRCRI